MRKTLALEAAACAAALFAGWRLGWAAAAGAAVAGALLWRLARERGRAARAAREDAERAGRLAARLAEEEAALAKERAALADAERRAHVLARDLALRSAEASGALGELGAFSYSISHDLRAPLRAIDGFSRILAEEHGGSLDAEGLRILGVVRSNAGRLGRLIDDLLAYSRLARVELSLGTVDMSALARSAYDALAAASRPGRLPPLRLGELPPAWGDPAFLRAVVEALLSNAVKFSSHKTDGDVQVSGKLTEGECVYSVVDKGAGFDMRYADKLFGVFQRLHTHDEFEGTGMGLALAKRAVHRHGGRIWAEGRVAEGAAFHFALPRGEASHG